MNKWYNIGCVIMIFLSMNVQVFGGNKDRSGQAGAPELLINPWARSAGMGLSNPAYTKGTEALFSNVAGISATKKTEINFAHTRWLSSSGIAINAAGLTQKTGESSTLGLAFVAMQAGDILRTTEDMPEGIGTYTPTFMTIHMAYARTFSEQIQGGATLKIISESIADLSAQGIAMDAGIQYRTGSTDQICFGITLKNIGPSLVFTGNGLTFRGVVSGSNNTLTMAQLSERYELPSLLNIGMSYDLAFGESHQVTLAGGFISNSFTNDQFTFGIDYQFKNYVSLRGGYTYEKGIFDATERTSALLGPSAGFSVDVPFNKEKGSIFSVDYSYRVTHPFDGIHTVGIRMSL